jgi:pimeloyl-ACP methyl ester carboxylesterase
VGRSLPLSRPTLLSEGSTSPPIFPRIIDILVETIPGAERVSYDGAAHVPHVTHPDEVARTVDAFAAAN